MGILTTYPPFGIVTVFSMAPHHRAFRLGGTLGSAAVTAIVLLELTVTHMTWVSPAAYRLSVVFTCLESCPAIGKPSSDRVQFRATPWRSCSNSPHMLYEWCPLDSPVCKSTVSVRKQCVTCECPPVSVMCTTSETDKKVLDSVSFTETVHPAYINLAQFYKL